MDQFFIPPKHAHDHGVVVDPPPYQAFCIADYGHRSAVNVIVAINRHHGARRVERYAAFDDGGFRYSSSAVERMRSDRMNEVLTEILPQ